jgi:DNA-binding Xre family transcriptional regulator
VRIRIPELLEERGVNAYQLHKRSGGRISLSTAYRLKRLRGRVKTFDAGLLEELCEVLGIRSLDELLERDATPKRRGRG